MRIKWFGRLGLAKRSSSRHVSSPPRPPRKPFTRITLVKRPQASRFARFNPNLPCAFSGVYSSRRRRSRQRDDQTVQPVLCGNEVEDDEVCGKNKPGKWFGRLGLNQRPPPCQGGALPLSYARTYKKQKSDQV